MSVFLPKLLLVLLGLDDILGSASPPASNRARASVGEVCGDGSVSLWVWLAITLRTRPLAFYLFGPRYRWRQLRVRQAMR